MDTSHFEISSLVLLAHVRACWEEDHASEVMCQQQTNHSNRLLRFIAEYCTFSTCTWVPVAFAIVNNMLSPVSGYTTDGCGARELGPKWASKTVSGTDETLRIRIYNKHEMNSSICSRVHHVAAFLSSLSLRYLIAQHWCWTAQRFQVTWRSRSDGKYFMQPKRISCNKRLRASKKKLDMLPSLFKKHNNTLCSTGSQFDHAAGRL